MLHILVISWLIIILCSVIHKFQVIVGNGTLGRQHMISHLLTHPLPTFLTPEREQSVEQLRAEVNRSDVICVVYSVEDEDTLDRVTGHWLPLIRSTLGQHHHTPIILVGNKVDLVDYSTMEVRLNVPELVKFRRMGSVKLA